MKNVAKEYALAAFSQAEAKGCLERFLEEYEAFSNSLKEYEMRFFSHPKISKKEKKQVIEKTTEAGLLRYVLFLLIDNDRFALHQDILVELQKRMNLNQNAIEGVVYTKVPLSKKQLDAIATALSETTNKRILLSQTIDQTIIGGWKADIDGLVFDETINRQIEMFKQKMKHS